MFFKLHSEGRIGYKQLTDAELGSKPTAHQTHIGLFDDILTYLYDRRVEEEAMFIYNNESDLIDCYFDRIERPDGTFRSPKIRKGEDNAVSVVTVIRDKAAECPRYYKWFLIWFGLESGMMVFYLLNDHMPDYERVNDIIDLSKGRGRIKLGDSRFDSLIAYLEDIVNSNSGTILEQLEVASQAGSESFKPFDIDRASEVFKTTGRMGEALVAAYLERLKLGKQIISYNWMNRDQELGMPYDFTIQMPNESVVYVDVKATKYRFEQPMVFSGQELQFICKVPHYSIFRVYGLAGETNCLRVCANVGEYAVGLLDSVNNFKWQIGAKGANLQSVKIEVSPAIGALRFSQPINL